MPRREKMSHVPLQNSIWSQTIFILNFMKEYRLVIDTLKECISDLLASGSIDRSILSNTLLSLEKSLDKAITDNKPTGELNKLISDIKYIKYDLL